MIARWIPGYIVLEKNWRADKAAKEAHYEKKVKTAKWTSLTYIRGQIIDEKKKPRYVSGMSRRQKNEEVLLYPML